MMSESGYNSSSAGDLPTEWTRPRLGKLFEQVVDVGHRDDFTVLAVSLREGVVERSSLNRKLTGEVERDKYLVVQDGDIVYNTMRMWQGASGLAHQTGYVSPAYTVCRPHDDECPDFWAQAFRAQHYIDKFHAFSQGVANDRLRLYFDQFSEVPVLRPPLPEQRQIAKILDTVDETIRKTEQLIAKLEQVKQGLLHDLLTRGIDDNGELRDPVRHPEQFKESVLGRIPKEWEWIPLGDLAEVAGGVTLGRSLSGPGILELPYLRVANVQEGFLDLSEIKTVRILASEETRFRLQHGDVLMNEGGDFDKLGRGTVWEDQLPRCLHQNHVFRVRCRKEILRPWYLAAVSGSAIGKSYFVRASKQTTNLATINSTQIKAFQVPLPCLREQGRITKALSIAQKRLDLETVEVEKLRLLKQGLMEDLLTGRVRVTHLLDEPSE